jgi:RimJ/RimL family protein N-acetyltransferase
VSVVETVRLRLRELSAGDAPFVLELLNDPDFISNIGDRGVRTLHDARRYIVSGPVASYARYGFGLYLVEQKRPLQAVGLCGLLHRDSHPDVEIGFALLPQYRRQGYTLEAARAVMQLGLGQLGLTRIVAITAPDNRPSVRILEALDLKFERMVHFADDGSESRLYVLESRSADTLPSP